MKRITITQATFVPGEDPSQPEMLDVGTTVDLDDAVAGQVVAAGRGRWDKDAKLKRVRPAAPAADGAGGGGGGGGEVKKD